ncbi:hypothetical protein N9V68_01215 [Octadecabacter sp.]|nr:hypothetical protein [Octadecabacter sp.]
MDERVRPYAADKVAMAYDVLGIPANCPKDRCASALIASTSARTAVLVIWIRPKRWLTASTPSPPSLTHSGPSMWVFSTLDCKATRVFTDIDEDTWDMIKDVKTNAMSLGMQETNRSGA